MNRVLSWDSVSGLIECEGGATIETLWRHCIEDGWWPPVVSGTMYPTLAGALAMNIHGKNNFRVGTLGEHVLEIDLLSPQGELITLTPEQPLFYAVISGLGMLGVIVRVKLQMKKIDTGNLSVFAVSPTNWQEQFELFEENEPTADYMVSWVDCFAKGTRAGRGQFHSGTYSHAEHTDQRSLWTDAQDLPDTILGVVPKSIVWRILKLLCNRPGMKFLNGLKDKSGRLLDNGKVHTQSLVAFSFLLDYVPNWRNSYQPYGFIQYQSFVPKQFAREVFQKQIELQQAIGQEAFLGVMKRHRCDNFLFSHGVDGYSLALDFKVSKNNWPRLQDLCHRMNSLVLDAGGRFYLAKDSTLRPSDLSEYLGDLNLRKYAELKRSLDPEGLLCSSLANRLKLDFQSIESL
jgi:decaprenylphospho-beta-D-ribofuranose 2-oxidase